MRCCVSWGLFWLMLWRAQNICWLSYPSPSPSTPTPSLFSYVLINFCVSVLFDVFTSVMSHSGIYSFRIGNIYWQSADRAGLDKALMGDNLEYKRFPIQNTLGLCYTLSTSLSLSVYIYVILSFCVYIYIMYVINGRAFLVNRWSPIVCTGKSCVAFLRSTQATRSRFI